MALTWCSMALTWRQIGCWTWAFSLRIDKIIEQIRLDWRVWTATWPKEGQELVEDLSQVKYVSNFDYSNVSEVIIHRHWQDRTLLVVRQRSSGARGLRWS